MEINHKHRKVAGVFLILCMMVYIAATPMIDASSLESALTHHDEAKAAKYIDFPALRENVKRSLNEMIIEEFSKPGMSKEALQANAMIASAMIAPMIEQVVTPNGLSIMLASGKFNADRVEPSASQPVTAGAKSPVQISMGYEGLHTFVIKVFDQNTPNKTISLVMTREGIVSWKLTSLRFHK